MLKKTLMAAAVFACATTAVQANEVSGYLTGSVGQEKAEKPKVVKEEQGFFKELGGSTSSDRTDTAYKIAVGLQANQYIALELQYVDLGESTYKVRKSGIWSGEPWSSNTKFILKTSGFGANLVGTLPIEEFTLFAKAGYHYLKTKGYDKFSYTETYRGVTGTYVFKDSGTIKKWTPSFGVGASYNFTKELAVVAEYERYQGVADKKIQGVNFKHDIDLASVGLRYNF